MSFNKKFFTTGGIVAASEPAEAAFDPLANFETVTYTGNGGTKKVNGYIRKGVAGFDDDQYITYPNITGAIDNSTNTDFAISLFFNLTSIPSSSSVFQTMFGKGDPTTSSNYQMLGLLLRGTSNTDEVEFELRRGYGGATYDGTSSPKTTLSANTWYHLLINYTASTKVAEFFIDNTSIGSDTISSSASGRTIESGFNLGSYRVGVSSNLQGKVDQFRILDTPITNSTNRQKLADEDYSKATKSTTDIFGDGSGVALYEFEDSADDTAGAGTNGKFGDAAFFNGSSSVFDTNVSVSTNWTVSLWLNRTPSGYFGGTTNSQVRNGVYFYANSNGSLQVYNRNSSGGNIDTLTTSTGLVTEGVFHHIAITFDSTSGTGLTTVYVDGTSAGTLDGTPTHSTDFKFGRSGDYAVEYFNGKIDDIRIYSDVLSSAEVGYIYNNTTASIPTDNLTAYYKLDGDATDEQGSYDGTASNVTFGYDGTPTNVDFLGMAFQPDLVWIKNRDTTAVGVINDSINGEGYYLIPSTTNTLSTLQTDVFTSFDSNGFTVGTSSATNGNTNDIVAWCWKAGGTAVSGTGTNVTNVEVSANQAAGFSIVKYTGSNSAESYQHGLSQAPEFIITKNLDVADNWYCYHKDIGTGKYILLNDDAIQTTYAAAYSSITSTTVANDVNNGTNDLIAYHFHSVDGYQRVGTYNGTGLSGNRIYTTDDGTSSGAGGFEPRFVMIKSTTLSNTNWVMIDHLRDNADEWLYANESDSKFDDANTYTELNSDGFTVNLTASYVNSSGQTYIYLAIA